MWLSENIDHHYKTFSPRWIFLNFADFFTLKIWTQSDHWLKSYGQKVNFCWLKLNFLAITFETVVWWFWNFVCAKINRIDDWFAKAVCQKQVIHLGEKRSTWTRILCTLNANIQLVRFGGGKGNLNLRTFWWICAETQDLLWFTTFVCKVWD